MKKQQDTQKTNLVCGGGVTAGWRAGGEVELAERGCQLENGMRLHSPDEGGRSFRRSSASREKAGPCSLMVSLLQGREKPSTSDSRVGGQSLRLNHNQSELGEKKPPGMSFLGSSWF